MIVFSNQLGNIPTVHQSGQITQNLDIELFSLIKETDPDTVGSQSLDLTDAQSILILSKTTYDNLERRQKETVGDLEFIEVSKKRIESEIEILRQERRDILAPVQAETPVPKITSVPEDQQVTDEKFDHFWGLGSCRPQSDQPYLPAWTKWFLTCWLSPLILMPNTLLYSVSVVFSGTIGAVFVAFYFKMPDIWARMFLGTIAGFVALLILKGGKFLFILDVGVVSTDNPYAGALAGMLSGLFTDRGFRLIESLVISTITRVETSAQKNNGQPEVIPADDALSPVAKPKGEEDAPSPATKKEGDDDALSQAAKPEDDTKLGSNTGILDVFATARKKTGTGGT